MNSYWKTTRMVLICLAVIAGGFWISVTFLGENWSDQGHYLLTLLNMLMLILLSAALLVAVFKVAALLWEKLVSGAAKDSDDPPTQPGSGQA